MAGPLSFTYVKVGVLMEAYSECSGWWWFDEVGGGWSRTESQLRGLAVVGTIGSLGGT